MITLVNNAEVSANEVILKNLLWCDHFDFATAYLTNGGFYILSDPIIEFVKRGGSIRMIVDIESGYSDYNAILEFATLVGDCKCKIFVGSNEPNSGVFHPKFYLFYKNNETRTVIGSSNLTRGGLLYNVEANIALDETKFNKRVQFELRQFFETLWRSPKSLAVEDNDRLLEDYRVTSYKYKHKIKTAKHVITQLPEIKKLKETGKKFEQLTKQELSHLYSDPTIAYLLGLVCGKGRINIEKETISFSYFNNVGEEGLINGLNVSLDALESHKYAAENIVDVFDIVSGLFNEEINSKINTSRKNVRITTTIDISFPQKSNFFKFILNAFNKALNNHEYSIPTSVQNSKSNEILRAFIRGYADVSSLISAGTQLFGVGKFRIYINVYGSNIKLMNQLIFLLSKLSVKCGRHDRRKSPQDKREMQIRVYPESFLTVGYSVSWKKRLLYDFIRANKEISSKSRQNLDLDLNP